MFARTYIAKGQFLVQYSGELLSGDEGDRRESLSESGFRYFFQHRGSYYWYIASFLIVVNCVMFVLLPTISSRRQIHVRVRLSMIIC